jgi:hypothetical protein
MLQVIYYTTGNIHLSHIKPNSIMVSHACYTVFGCATSRIESYRISKNRYELTAEIEPVNPWKTIGTASPFGKFYSKNNGIKI